MKQTILTNWTFVRILRLLLGLGIIVQAVIVKDAFLGASGLLFSSMAVFNVVCCGIGGCATTPKKPSKTIYDTTYEEVA